MSHIQAIGFDAPDENAFRTMIMGLIQGRGEPYYYDSDNCYFCLGDKSGAQIWLFISGKKEILGFAPHYEGEARFPVTLVQKQVGEDSMQGNWQAYCGQADIENPKAGQDLFIFECPDTLTFSPPLLPWFTNIQLSAFAHEIAFWPDENTFLEAHKASDAPPSVREFIVPALEEAEQGPIPMAQLTGKVIQTAELTNSFTGQKFMHAVVETKGGKIDLVWHKNMYDKVPAAGSIVMVTAWLSGRIVDRPRLKGKGLRGLLFGRKS